MSKRIRHAALAGLVLSALTAGGTVAAQPGDDYEDPIPFSTVDPLVSPMVYQGGTVVLRVTVSASGRVSDVEVVSGFPALTRPVVDAVIQWRFSPAKLGGRPIAATTTVVVHVALQRAVAPPPL